MPYLSVAASALLSAATLFSPVNSAPAASGRITSPAALSKFVMRATNRVPSFSRQTELACAMCHNGFPQLTPFGRLFKLIVLEIAFRRKLRVP